jgi:hypothetical protein
VLAESRNYLAMKNMNLCVFSTGAGRLRTHSSPVGAGAGAGAEGGGATLSYIAHNRPAVREMGCVWGTPVPPLPPLSGVAAYPDYQTSALSKKCVRLSNTGSLDFVTTALNPPLNPSLSPPSAADSAVPPGGGGGWWGEAGQVGRVDYTM